MKVNSMYMSKVIVLDHIRSKQTPEGRVDQIETNSTSGDKVSIFEIH